MVTQHVNVISTKTFTTRQVQGLAKSVLGRFESRFRPQLSELQPIRASQGSLIIEERRTLLAKLARVCIKVLREGNI